MQFTGAKSNRSKDWELHAPLVFIIFLKDSLLLCQFISEQNQKQKDYFMPVSLVLPNHSELLSVFLFLVMVAPSKFQLLTSHPEFGGQLTHRVCVAIFKNACPCPPNSGNTVQSQLNLYPLDGA